MRLLPDKNFKANYQKRYKANYDKIMEKQAIKKPYSYDITKQRIAGCIVFFIIIFIFVIIGISISNVYSKKEATIEILTNKISKLNEAIREYQVVDGDTKYAQLDEAVNYIVDLQNQYVLNEFDDNFDTYAVRYLGSFNYNWAENLRDFERPIWKGYRDKSCDYKDVAEMLFILYERTTPVMIVSVRFDMDRFGNLGEMISANKAVLV